MARLPEPVTALGQAVEPRSPRILSSVNTGPLDAQLAPSRAEMTAGIDLAQASEHLDTINTTKAENAFNDLRSRQMDLTTGPDGFVNVRGGNAIDPKFMPTQIQRFTDAQKAVGETLTNDRQQYLFAQRSKVAELQYKEQLLAHVHKENDAFQQQTAQATISTEVQSIGQNYQDQKAIGLSNVRIAAALDGEARREGWSPELKKEKVQQIEDAAWTARLHAQMVNDPSGALRTFTANKDQISPNLRESLFTKLKTAALPVEAKDAATAIIGGKGMQLLADRIASGDPTQVDQAIRDGVAAAPSGSVNPGGPGAAGLPSTGSKYDIKAGFMGWVQQAEEIAQKQHPDDPVYRDLLVQNVKSHMNTLVTAQDGLARLAHASLMQAATPQPNQGPAPMSLDQLLTTPELRNAWTVTDPNSQRGILAVLEHNARLAQGVPIRTNPAVFEGLFNRVYLPYDDPRRLRTPAQLAPYLAHGINRTDYDWLKARMDEALTDDGQRLGDVRKMFFEQAKAQFDSSTMIFHDSKGKNDNYNFWYYATDQERQARAAGKDPYALYNPKSPDYLGNKIPAFQRGLEQRINDMAKDLERQSPGAAVPAPGAPAPAPAAVQQYPEGTISVNKKTGEKLIMLGGKWQPTK